MKWILLFAFFLFLSCNSKPCINGTINAPKCDQCPQGKIFMDGQCAILVAPPQESVDDPQFQTK